MSENPFRKTPFPDFKDLDKLSQQQAGEEIEQLREAIEYHNHKYYIENDPVVSDRAYDELFQRLSGLEKKFPEFDSDISPTRKVGAPPIDELKKRKHRASMLSLNSSGKKEEVSDFVKFIKDYTKSGSPEFMLEPKFDGLSVEIVYENGYFSYAATRGDGETGEDISENVKTIRTVPLRLLSKEDLPDVMAVRGEIFMSKEGFQQLNKTRIEMDEKPFANARNATAGLVRQLDPEKVADKPLDIFFYEILDAGNKSFEFQDEMVDRLDKWGLKTNPLRRKADKESDIFDFFEQVNEKREELSYEIDGIVIKTNDRRLKDRLGSRDRSPRWAFAMKFEPQKKVTTLVDIIVQVGRTGILTPVALLEPVEVGGVTVSRATLHNEDEVKKKDVRPGDKVKIVRAGDVIPEVANRVEESGKKRGKSFEMPSKCPVCDTEVVREGAYVLCPAGLACPAQLKGRLIHFASREAMNIENLGEKIVEQMVHRNMIREFHDLYKLKPSDFEQLEGFSEKSANKLYEAIQDSMHPQLDQFLYALGIRHVGRHIARVLARKYGSLDAVIQADYESLAAIQEIGPEIAESISHFFSTRDNLDMIENLKKTGIEVQREKSKKSDKLEGKTFVITGQLEDFTRDEAKDRIESLGGKATSSVSDNTDYLVVGEDPGSKLDEARKREVKILDENGFKKILSE